MLQERDARQDDVMYQNGKREGSTDRGLCKYSPC